MTDRICTDRNVYRANRFFSCFDRVEEVSLVVLAFNQVNLILANRQSLHDVPARLLRKG